VPTIKENPRTFVAADPKETYLNELQRAKTTTYYVSIKSFICGVQIFV